MDGEAGDGGGEWMTSTSSSIYSEAGERTTHSILNGHVGKVIMVHHINQQYCRQQFEARVDTKTL
jgi:hypothetical protein